MYIPNTLRIPDTLEVTVTRVPGGDDGQHDRYLASARGVTFEACHEHPWVATLFVLCAVSDAQPLAQDCVSEILGAGFGTEVVDAWQRHVGGPRLSDVRHVGEAAVNYLADYLSVQVPLDQACEYLALGITPHTARDAHTEGRTASEVAPYAKRLAQFSDRAYESDYDDTSPYAFNAYQVVAWALSEFDPDQSHLYAQVGLEPGSAAQWHGVVTEQRISVDDLRDILAAGFTPERVRSNSDAYATSGASVGEAARTILALRRPGVGTRHWVDQPNPWGQPRHSGAAYYTSGYTNQGAYTVPSGQVPPSGDPWAAAPSGS